MHLQGGQNIQVLQSFGSSQYGIVIPDDLASVAVGKSAIILKCHPPHPLIFISPHTCMYQMRAKEKRKPTWGNHQDGHQEHKLCWSFLHLCDVERSTYDDGLLFFIHSIVIYGCKPGKSHTFPTWKLDRFIFSNLMLLHNYPLFVRGWASWFILKYFHKWKLMMCIHSI